MQLPFKLTLPSPGLLPTESDNVGSFGAVRREFGNFWSFRGSGVALTDRCVPGMPGI